MTSSTDHADQCRAAGMQAFINKPIEAHKLFAAIEAVLEPVNAEQGISHPALPFAPAEAGTPPSLRARR